MTGGPIIETRYARMSRRFVRLPDNIKGICCILLAAFGFTLMTLCLKIAGERLHVTQILFVRQCIMTAMVAPYVASHFPDCLKTSRPDLQMLRIALALVAMLCGFHAIIHMPLADATAIGFAKSFFVTIFAIIVLGERVRWQRWMAVILGFIGVLVMVRPGTAGFDPYAVYALVGAAAAGSVMVVIRKLSQTDEPVTILTYQAVFVGLAMVAPAWYFWVAPTPREWLLLLAVGVISWGAQMLNIYAYKFGEASMLASLDYARLLYATFFGWLIFSTLPGMWTLIGSAIIIGASIYTIHRERTMGQRLASAADGRGFSTS